MVSSNANALGIIFPNSYDSLVPELVSKRLMASIPFASRYRMIDFLLSSMVNSGIDNISIVLRQNYRSLMDHLGSGREWDLTRKNGGLNIIPPFSEKSINVYSGRVEALANILPLLRSSKEKYVVMADSNVAANIRFSDVIAAHEASGADVTVLYCRTDFSKRASDTRTDSGEFYYTLQIDEDQRVNEIHINALDVGVQNQSLNIYIVDREFLITQIEDASVRGITYYERDVLLPSLDRILVKGYEFTGYVALISGIKSYFDENMALLKEENADALFAGNSIYTKVRDDNPTRYTASAQVKNIMAADGCVIEGTVENCVLFRGVKVAKGAVVKNCILMQDTVISENVTAEYLITDKNVTITANQEVKGTSSYPVYISKRKIV
ncbi:glucose-1-phosphate adenylyltransferase subunit GlgD [Lachnospiraceae bacterium 47-T17]